ncbi:TniB family NTP-binding protein [Thioclava nitratireducens]|uniref:TniB family NTP-binding protein n=1 Tax=Thioclava nitratireducens TaxID=1915078 RepID=UPI0024801BE8|nr:TniB family NTP-binding protein [Thioclava nitratireducens]WGT48647.1 TniB family NTP-binding protein [Thioclava nitratireducens]
MNELLFGKRIEHERYTAAYEEMCERISLCADKGGVVPLLGPTRSGKSELLRHLRNDLGHWRRLNMVADTCDFALGSLAPKPSEKTLLGALLSTIEPRANFSRESTELVRKRLIKLIEDRKIRILALDEVSHCAERGANFPPRSATDHFKSLIDETGVVLILSGLPKFQKLIDDNEQLRDRAMRTVTLHPYAWGDDADREAFLGAVYPFFDLLEENGYTLDFDQADAIRRLYGASGGRIGPVVRLLSHCIRLIGDRKAVEFSDLSKAYRACTQAPSNLPDMFELEDLDDFHLECAYASVMKDADIAVAPTRLQQFCAQKSLVGE